MNIEKVGAGVRGVLDDGRIFETLRPGDDWLAITVAGNLVEAQTQGQCLRPWFASGDLVYIAKGLEPRPNELVWVNLPFERATGFGTRQLRLEPSLKQLRIVDGVRWLACADGAIELDGTHVVEGRRFKIGEIIGTAVAIVRTPREPLPPIAELNFEIDAHSWKHGRAQLR
jgi:hypothetical protein